MIDIHTEKLVDFQEATRLFPKRSGKHPHLATLHRWALDGSKGVRLEFVRMGSRRVTSVEAIQRFLDRATEADLAANGATPEKPTASRSKSIKAAEKRLARA